MLTHFTKGYYVILIWFICWYWLPRMWQGRTCIHTSCVYIEQYTCIFEYTLYLDTYIYTMLLVSRHAGAITFSIFWIVVLGRLFWHLDFQKHLRKHQPGRWNIRSWVPGYSIRDLFGMVKTWPFQVVKWPPTRGLKGHFESPRIWFFMFLFLMFGNLKGLIQRLYANLKLHALKLTGRTHGPFPAIFKTKFIFQPWIFKGEMLVSGRVLGFPWYLVNGFITLYKLVVSPISRLYKSLLTSYDHFHGHRGSYVSQLESWISLQGGCRRQTSQGGGR